MSQPTEDNEHYHGYSVDTEDQPQSTGDSTADSRGLPEPLDEGYSPPEKWSAGQRYGNTEWEADQGEPLEARLSQEEADVPAADLAEGDVVGGEIGARRAGRLVEDDAGSRPDTGSFGAQDMYATDIGIDGAAASAEEAAVHIIEDDADIV